MGYELLGMVAMTIFGLLRLRHLHASVTARAPPASKFPVGEGDPVHLAPSLLSIVIYQDGAMRATHWADTPIDHTHP